MTILRDIARAKINLTLEVRGRRSDSYHELESLVAFAELGDIVEFAFRDELALTIDGPFAKGLSSAGNLVIEAANAAKAVCPGLKLGRFRLTKNLPVAAGLGGGSADAAAALRLLARANGDALSPEALGALAAGLGSDVTICLNSRPALMYGRGEKVVELSGFPSCGVLLANPGVDWRRPTSTTPCRHRRCPNRPRRAPTCPTSQAAWSRCSTMPARVATICKHPPSPWRPPSKGCWPPLRLSRAPASSGCREAGRPALRCLPVGG